MSLNHLTSITDICRTKIPCYDPWRDKGTWEFDAGRAQSAVDYFRNHLTLATGPDAGSSFVLEEWQQAIVGNLYGWWRGDERRYREAFVFVPRKNGKTAFSAGLMVMELVLSLRSMRGGEFYSAASTRDQASIIFRDAARMVQSNKTLSRRLKITRSHKLIEDTESGNFYRALASEAGPVHGTRPVFAIIDELHAHPNDELINAILTGTAIKGTQPLVVYITTSDYDRESVCNAKHAYATAVRDGNVRDSRHLPVIYEAQLDDDWTDPEVWKKANPNYGVSVDETYLADACEKAKHMPSLLNEFKRLHLNVKTQSVEAWLDMDAWDKCPSELPYLDGEECYGGLDLSSTKDITAFVLWFPEQKACKCWFWLPGDNADIRYRKSGVPYPQWVQDGYITETPGTWIEPDSVYEAIREASERYVIRQIGVDIHQAAAMFVKLQSLGGEDWAVKFEQSKREYTSPCKSLERMIGDCALNHGGNKVLRWMAGNTMIEHEAQKQQMMPSKKHSSEKIDGIAALCMAIGTCEADDIAADVSLEVFTA